MKIFEKLKDHMVVKSQYGSWGILYRKDNGWWHIVYQGGGQVFTEKDFAEYVSEVYECNDKGQYYALQFLANPEMHIKNYTKIYPPRPVPFLEAVKAYSEGKTVKCEYSSVIHRYKQEGNGFVDENGEAITSYEILNGTWTAEG